MRVAAALLLLTLALSGCGGGPHEAPPKPLKVSLHGCRDARVKPRPDNLPHVRATTLCLINDERAGRGLPPLHEEARLQRAAELHSLDMVNRRFADHVNPDGAGPAARILRQAYDGARAGENLAWSSPGGADPVHRVYAWMHSEGHREAILNPHFSEIGIGLAYGPGPPQRHLDTQMGWFYTTDFGGR